MILSLKNHSEKKEALMENKFLKEKIASGGQNNGGAAASMVSDLEQRLRKVEDRKAAEIKKYQDQLLDQERKMDEKTKLDELVANRDKVRVEQLSPIAKRIIAMPAIGKVINANSEWGFLNFDAGSESGVAAGMEFAVRRDHFLIARVKVETSEANKSVANIVGTVSEGMQIQPGDDMIAYPVQ